MEYLLKASAVVCIFYLCFQLLLKRETLFNHNRWFLLTGLIIALVFPFVVIPIYIPVETVSPQAAYIVNGNHLNEIVINQTNQAFEWTTLLAIIYGIGFTMLFLQFLFQFGSLILLLLKNPKNKEGIYTYVIVRNTISPFSFFKWIVFNPENYSEDELELILMHEKVHVNQLHSIDILFTQLSCVIFWFNPLIWFYKKEIHQNLEYIADNTTQTISKNEREYQRLLLKTSVPNHNISLSNNFYNSQIKKRIIMLHKSRSNTKKQWRYLLVLPLLAGLLMSMNTEKIYTKSNTESTDPKKTLGSADPKDYHNALANTITTSEEKSTETLDLRTEKSNKSNERIKTFVTSAISSTIKDNLKDVQNETAKNNLNPIGDISITVIDKNTTDSELDKIKDELKNEGLTVKFKGVKRNSSGEITAIKIDAKSKNSNASYNINSDDAISPVKIIFDIENDSISIGNGHRRHGENTFVYETHEGGDYKIHKSGKGNHVYVVTEEYEDEHDGKHEHEARIVIKENGKKGKVKTIRRSKNVEVISGDDDVIEVIVESDGNDEDDIIVVNGNKIKTSDKDVEVIVEEKGNKNVWVTKSGDDDEDIVIELDSDNDNIFISDKNGKNPLYIVDGKEVSKEEFQKLKPKNIDTMTVLKDESAMEKYGDKGKNGVIIVKTKKN